MRPYTRTSTVLFTLSTLAFLGILEVSSQAGKPTLPPGAPTIVLSGAIEGIGRATAIRVAFDTSFGEPVASVIANPDFSAAVYVGGVNK